MTESAIIREFGDVEVAELVPGEDDAVIRFDSLDQQQVLLARMIETARRSIVLFAGQFDMALWGQEKVVGALTTSMNATRGLTMQCLVRSSAELIRSGSPLIERLRQFGPAVECRLRKRDVGGFSASCVMIDGVAYLYFPNPERRTGTACFNGVATVSQVSELFEQAWQLAEPDPDLRVLHL